MKKRYVKRLIRKIVFFVLTIAFISLVTSLIVEKRLESNQKASNAEKEDAKLDPNGDPVTEPYRAKHKIVTPRQPRPPVQLRETVAKLVEISEPEDDWDTELFDVPETRFQLIMPKGSKKDWNDYEQLAADATRVGVGEQGAAAAITDPSLKELEKKLYGENGFNGLLSDSISVNRSLPDVRVDSCKKKLYLANLPTVSIILPFYNEYFSVLLRSLYSIVNRTPAHLLEEIIIVDDFSDREYLQKPLDDYMAEHFANVVKIVRLPERTGLIGARLAGAKAASGQVLIFFDSHIECNHNWLPPLLEPIVVNPSISTCPIVDSVDHGTFEYKGDGNKGGRGVFDWHFNYKTLTLREQDLKYPDKPYQNPVMMGGLFAIDKDFFWKLGGYDDQLEIWGAEQFELSFKIWLCGGVLLDVPCSRVAHIFRGPMDPRPSVKKYSFVDRNHKRVAEVWMDEYKEYIYMRKGESYANVELGDLSAQMAVKERLKCKPFKWFLEVVAPDLLEKFPTIEPPDYASGVLQSLAYPNQCLDTMNRNKDESVGLFSCALNKTHPQENQNCRLGHTHDLSIRDMCFDVSQSPPNASVLFWSCHNQGGNQFWHYDRTKHWVLNKEAANLCLEAFVESNGQHAVYMNFCDESNVRMKWRFGFVNDTMMDEWEKSKTH